MTESTVPAALPLFYKEPAIINVEQHRNLTIAPSPKGYSFASEAHFVMLTAVEFPQACREYPILFSATDDGTVRPLALLGIQQGENLYVDETGAWKASYIPAYVRRYPFIPAETGSPELPVCFDQAFDGLNIEEGQRIFDESGEQTEYCRHIQAFILDYQNQQPPTAAFAEKLKELGLFRHMDATFELNDGRKFVLQGFLVVDEEKLARLGDVAVLDLFRKGYLGLIYAHLASIGNISRLVDLKADRKDV